VAELDRDLTATTEKLQALLQMAGKDARFRIVETYRGYRVQDFANRKRGDPDAEDLLDIMLDPTAPYDLRKYAFDTLTGTDAMRYDPDLVQVKDRKKPRAKFAKAKVVKHLSHKDRFSRQFTHDLLCAWFSTHASDPAVATYDAQNGTRASWKRAEKHWRDVLD